MTVKIFRNEIFETTHENIIFNEMIGELEKQWSNSSDLVVMLGNFYTNGTQIDAVIVKRNSISVIDFKNYGGKITFSENDTWKANGVPIKMGGKINPYRQIHHAKYELKSKLEANPIFKKGNVVNLFHISGIVIFHQPILFDNHSIPPKIGWFHVTDIFNSVKWINDITSKQINLSEEEILCFADLFDLKEYEFTRPKIAIEVEKFINKEALINELYKLNDIFNCIEIVKDEAVKMVEKHNNFIEYFYPDNKPEDCLIYHIANYHKKYDLKREEFILKQNEILLSQIDLIFNLNTTSGYVLNEFTKDKNLKAFLGSRFNTRKIIDNLIKKYNVLSESKKLSISTYKGYFNFFYERGIFVEDPFILIGNEVQKKAKLINYFHELYIILRNWFGSDMILQHEINSEISDHEVMEIRNIKTGYYLFEENPEDYPPADLEITKKTVAIEKYKSIEEYKYARGFSERWYSNMMSQFKENEELEYYTNLSYTGFIVDEFKVSLPIAKVKLPQKLISLFHEFYIDITKILSEEEFIEILDLMNLSWILKDWIDIREIHILDLKTHLIYSNLYDISYLMNVHKYKYSGCFEPL